MLAEVTMHKFTFPLAAGFIVVSAAAFAADPAPQMLPAPIEWNGLYLSAHGGAVWLADVAADLSPDDAATFRMTPGYRVGGSIGYDFNQNFGVEGEVSYAAVGTDHLTIVGEGDAPITGSASS